MFDIAPEFNALIVFAEHRYYGESLPFALNVTFDREHIGYLSIEQALADYATLLLALKTQYNNAPVITFGGSYGGMLSGYMRMKYPFIVDMALAASAPYLDFTPQIDVYSFFGNITNTFRDANAQCPGVIQEGFSTLRALGNEGASGLAQLTQAFNLCSPLKASQVEHLILWAVNAFTTLAMCDYPYATDFCANLPAWPVNDACQGALAAKDALSGLAYASSLAYNGSASMTCFDIESEYIECADQTGCGTGPSGTAWDYQACTESVFLPTTNGQTDMFLARSWTLVDLKDYCLKKFGVIPRQSWLATEFGAGNIGRSASNIIFSNGLLDPWHAGGILQSLSPTLPAVLIAV
jgi:dipeptidyl-peptidase-2